MAYEQKPNTGSAFKNDKRTTDKHPNYTGSALIEGDAFFVDAWINVDKKGDRYISLKFKRKEQQADTRTKMMDNFDRGEAARRNERAELDDEIPF